MKAKATERGWAGHYCCSGDCLFRRNTLVESDEESVIVSTIGHRRHHGELEEIGIDRYYETMVFESVKHHYVDINPSKQINTPSNIKWSINKEELDQNINVIDNIANNMHEAMVKYFIGFVQETVVKNDR